MKPTIRRTTVSLALATAALGACSGGATGGQTEVKNSAFRDGLSPTIRDSDKLALTDQNVDYMLALRSAALKLTGNYPTFTEISELRSAPDQQATYAARVDTYLASGAFTREQISFWRNTFRMGAQDTVGVPVAKMEFAPTYAAQLVVTEQPFTNVVTATTGTCPTYTAGTNTFSAPAASNCVNNASVISGVLSDEGVQQQFYSSMAFRRARWVQETFMCSRFPAEQTGTAVKYPGGTYNSPWPWNSISGKESLPTARVDFQASDVLICANCHSSLNHIAPLFGKFNMTGVLVAGNAFQVTTPIPMEPATILADWLPAGETTAWRHMKPATTLPELGAAVAADPGFARCVATRVWNWAMSRGDVVNDGLPLTDALATQLTTQLVADQYNVKKLVRRIFTDPYFVRF